jgi:hypothetical protein
MGSDIPEEVFKHYRSIVVIDKKILRLSHFMFNLGILQKHISQFFSTIGRESIDCAVLLGYCCCFI